MQYLPEDLRFDPEITPAMIFRTLLPKARLRDALDLAGRIELDVKKPYGRLSTGNRRKTNLIAAEFSVKADAGNILLLDEPFSGLDAFARQAFEEIWKESADQRPAPGELPSGLRFHGNAQRPDDRRQQRPPSRRRAAKPGANSKTFSTEP